MKLLINYACTHARSEKGKTTLDKSISNKLFVGSLVV